MKLIYQGPNYGGIDIPSAGIESWKPEEERDVPDELGKELLERGDFGRVDAKRKPLTGGDADA